MKALMLLGLLLLVAACAPAFEPITDPAPGVTFTAEAGDGFTTFRAVAVEPLTRIAVRLPGTGLGVNERGCVATPLAVQCDVRPDGPWSVMVTGDVQLAPGAFVGIACRDADCWHLYLSE